MAVALIVIEVFIAVSGMPSNSRRMSPTCATGTPTLPTSPRASGSSASYPVWVGQVERHRQAGLPLGQVAAVQRVGRGRRRVTGVRPHHPGLVPLARHRGSVLSGGQAPWRQRRRARRAGRGAVGSPPAGAAGPVAGARAPGAGPACGRPGAPTGGGPGPRCRRARAATRPARRRCPAWSPPRARPTPAGPGPCSRRAAAAAPGRRRSADDPWTSGPTCANLRSWRGHGPGSRGRDPVGGRASPLVQGDPR